MSSSSAWAMQLRPCLILKNTHKQESVLSVQVCPRNMFYRRRGEAKEDCVELRCQALNAILGKLCSGSHSGLLFLEVPAILQAVHAPG